MEAEVRPFVKGGMAYSASETRAPEPTFVQGGMDKEISLSAPWGTEGDRGPVFCCGPKNNCCAAAAGPGL